MHTPVFYRQLPNRTQKPFTSYRGPWTQVAAQVAALVEKVAAVPVKTSPARHDHPIAPKIVYPSASA
jgi:hypothetical protein